jgi:stage V sporulation protein SpoVS
MAANTGDKKIIKRGSQLKDDTSLSEIKVSNKSTTKTISGALSHLARDHREVEILAGSAGALNVAIKAAAVARGYVSADNLDIGILPTLVVNDGRKIVSLKTYIFNNVQLDADTESLTVSAKTESGALAGAISARIRDKKTVTLTAVGASCVLRALTAVALAGKYVETVKNLAILPKFEKSGDGDAQISVLKLTIVPIA